MIENFKEGFDKFCKMLEGLSDEEFFEELKSVGIVFEDASVASSKNYKFIFQSIIEKNIIKQPQHLSFNCNIEDNNMLCA